MKMSRKIVPDLAIGLTAGLFATALTGPIQSALYRITPASVKRREEQVRPGSPTQVAAKRLAGSMDVRLSKEQTDAAATAIHYGSGIPWGAAYTFLRRYSGMTPLGAALVSGASMSLLLDESLTPAMGFSAPDRDYPALTHVRGFLAHLAFGAAAAAAAEILYRATGTAPEQPWPKVAA